MAFLMSAALAFHEFAAVYTVIWDDINMKYTTTNKDLQGKIKFVSERVVLFNVTAGSGAFYITHDFCSDGPKTALTRASLYGGVTNNVCNPPCVVAANLSNGIYSFCSSVYGGDSGRVVVQGCTESSSRTCGQYIGCGLSSETGDCIDCLSAKSSKECGKIKYCAWCSHDEMCVHENSTSCRAPVPRNRPVASWVWLLITVCALVVLIAVVITMFLAEASFKSRWAAMAKTDTDFAELGRGNKDGLSATD